MGMADPEGGVFIEVPGDTQPMLRVFGPLFRLIWVTLPKSVLRTVFCVHRPGRRKSHGGGG